MCLREMQVSIRFSEYKYELQIQESKCGESLNEQ